MEGTHLGAGRSVIVLSAYMNVGLTEGVSVNHGVEEVHSLCSAVQPAFSDSQCSQKTYRSPT